MDEGGKRNGEHSFAIQEQSAMGRRHTLKSPREQEGRQCGAEYCDDENSWKVSSTDAGLPKLTAAGRPGQGACRCAEVQSGCGPTPAPNRWRNGVVTPKAIAASAASTVPARIGFLAVRRSSRPLENGKPHAVERPFVGNRQVYFAGGGLEFGKAYR